MRKLILPGVCALLLLALAACGASAPAAQPTATSAPTATTAPQATAPTGGTATGGPGAVYTGSLEALAGPAPSKEVGDAQGNVPLEMLQKYEWIFQSDYYQQMVEKANLDNPTPLVSQGEEFQFQYACINRALEQCKLAEVYFAPNVRERTEGQIEVQVVSYPELGIAGPDMLQLIDDGTIGFGQVQPAYVGGDLPVIDLVYIWGLWEDREKDFAANTAILPDLDRYVSENTGGGKVIFHIWYAGNDQYFFSKRPLRTLEDFAGLKTRSHGTTISDYINGLGGEAQFVAFAEVYTALERGILDAGVTGALAAHGQRWYEVTEYMAGPAISMPMGFETMNARQWESLPQDLQQIMIEEGARMELENLRLAPVWNEVGVQKNVDEGMEFIPYSPELAEYIHDEITMGRILPSWISRVGGPGSAAVELFNAKFGPIAGLRIEADGTITSLPSAQR